MKLLLWILAPIASSLVFLVLSNLTLDKTVLSADYLQQKARDAKAYEVAVNVVPQQYMDSLGLPEQERAKIMEVAKNVKPDDIERVVGDVLQQVESVLQGEDSAITPDLAPVLDKLKAGGFEVPKDAITPIKVEIADYPQLQNGLGYSQTVKPYVYWGTAALVLVIILLSFLTKSFGSIVELFLVNAFTFGVVAFALTKLPGLLDKNIHFTGPWEAFGPVVRNLIGAVSSDLTKQFGLYAVVGAALGIATWIISFKFAPKSAPTAPAKAA